jgi:hypothetical protein
VLVHGSPRSVVCVFSLVLMSQAWLVGRPRKAVDCRLLGRVLPPGREPVGVCQRAVRSGSDYVSINIPAENKHFETESAKNVTSKFGS